MTNQFNTIQKIIVSLVIIMAILSIVTCLKSYCKKKRRYSSTNIIIPIENVTINLLDVEIPMTDAEITDKKCINTDAVAIEVAVEV